MSDVPPNMRQPTGYVARTDVKFDHTALTMRSKVKNPLIEGPTDPMHNWVLQKDILIANIIQPSLGRKERANVQSEHGAYTVVNGVKAASRAEFWSTRRVVGLATSKMTPHGIKPTDANIRVSVDLKGPTWMRNNNADITIRAGDVIMAEIPKDTADAERREGVLGSGEGGTPTQRYTPFPAVWDVETVMDAITEDVNRVLRREIPADRSMYPSTTEQVRNLRRMAMMGAALVQAIMNYDNAPDNTSLFTDRVRDSAVNNAQFRELVRGISNGAWDPAIAAMIAPTDEERVIRQAQVPPNTEPAVLAFHRLQMNGFKSMFENVDSSLNEAGKNRILGRATTDAVPGDTFGILLYG